jgi:hypothetical protein
MRICRYVTIVSFPLVTLVLLVDDSKISYNSDIQDGELTLGSRTETIALRFRLGRELGEGESGGHVAELYVDVNDHQERLMKIECDTRGEHK